MPNPFFRFKKFTIWHDKCAMKVGTDGVLLGAWCNPSHANTILDVGTGTGLIALMIAQRSPTALIHAIDIDSEACLQAGENVTKSIFHDRVSILHASFDRFTPSIPMKYDLIVSNPPYFSESLQCPDSQRNIARHDTELSMNNLLKKSISLLSSNGSISLILPFDKKEELEKLSSDYKLHISRQTVVRPTPASTPKRILTELKTQPQENPTFNELIIEIGRHQYTDEYISLTKEFYLKM